MSVGELSYPPELPWRTGRKVGRTIYVQLGSEPGDGDPLIGVMDTPDLATTAVEARNLARGEGMVAIAIETLNDLGVRVERYRAALERIAAGPMWAPHGEPWGKAEALIALGRAGA